MTLRPGIVLATALALAAGTAIADEPTGVVYATVEGHPLLLDLHLPDGPGGPWPLVIWIHGGSWRAGDRSRVPAELLDLVPAGVAVASVDYRLTSDTRFDQRAFPAQIHDVKGAVRFLRASADRWSLDPERFVAWGASAGGHLATLLGVSAGVGALEGEVGGNLDRSSEVGLVISFYAVADFEALGPGFDGLDDAEDALLGASHDAILAHLGDPSPPWPELVRRMRLASPVSHLDDGDPPLVVVHGTRDSLVPVEQSRILAEAAREAGIEAWLQLVPGADHAFAQMPAGWVVDVLRARLGLGTEPRVAAGRLAP